MRFASLGSGSRGNATLVEAGATRLLIDCGFSCAETEKRLARLSLTPQDIDAILVTHEHSDHISGVARFSRRFGVPVWMTSRRDLGFKRKKAYDRIFRLVSGSCTQCIANCRSIGDAIVSRGEISPGKVSVIFNGIDLDDFDQKRNNTELRREICAGQDVPIVGMVANFNFDIKGQQFFVKAARRVVEKVPEARFVLAGDGPLRSTCEEEATVLGIRDKVHFLGERSDVSGILRNLTVSVLSSTSEGLSNVILESMAAAKPVVATDVGGNPELVENGITGHIVPPADPEALADGILRLLRSPDRAKVMGEAARVRVEKDFSVGRMVERHADLYASALANGDRAGNQMKSGA